MLPVIMKIIYKNDVCVLYICVSDLLQSMGNITNVQMLYRKPEWKNNAAIMWTKMYW